MINRRRKLGLRGLFVVICVGVWAGPAAAQFDVPPPGGTDLICIEADPPVIVPNSAQLAARLAGYEPPKGLSVKQSQRLSQVAQAFRGGREQLALQQWGAAVTDAAQTVGARNLRPENIMDLMLLVLRQTLAEHSQGLRLLIAQIEHHNAEKAELRDYANKLQDLQASCSDTCDAVTRAAVNEEVGRVEDQLDVLGDISQELQTRLQNYLGPFTEAFAMLTNLFAKMSDSAQKIVDHLK